MTSAPEQGSEGPERIGIGPLHPAALALAERMESARAKCMLCGMSADEADAMLARACEECATSLAPDPAVIVDMWLEQMAEPIDPASLDRLAEAMAQRARTGR